MGLQANVGKATANWRQLSLVAAALLCHIPSANPLQLLISNGGECVYEPKWPIGKLRLGHWHVHIEFWDRLVG